LVFIEFYPVILAASSSRGNKFYFLYIDNRAGIVEYSNADKKTANCVKIRAVKIHDV